MDTPQVATITRETWNGAKWILDTLFYEKMVENFYLDIEWIEMGAGWIYAKPWVMTTA